MHSPHLRHALAAAAFVALLPLQAHASVSLINTSAPTNGLIGSNTVDSGNWIAEKFSFASATQIDGIQAFVMSSDTDGNDLGKTFTLALYADQGGLPALSLGHLYDTTVTFNGNGWNGNSGLNWSLAAGSYWFALEAGSDATSTTYLQAPTGALPAAEAVAYYSGGPRYVSTGVSDSFGLQVSAVPEPSSIALLFAGMGLLALTARRRSGH